MSAIWSPKRVPNGVCCKISYKGYEISIAMDDSCGALKEYSRTDIRVFAESDDSDVTVQFLKGDEYMLYGDAETLIRIFAHIDAITG